MVENLPSGVGAVGLIPGHSTEISPATGQQSLRAAMKAPARCNSPDEATDK